MKALASKDMDNRTVYVIEGREVRPGDEVTVVDKDGIAQRATVRSGGTLVFAISRNGK